MDDLGPMTIGELRQELQAWPDETPIAMFSDAEGNDIKPLKGAAIDRGSISVKRGIGFVGEGDERILFLVPFD